MTLSWMQWHAGAAFLRVFELRELTSSLCSNGGADAWWSRVWECRYRATIHPPFHHSHVLISHNLCLPGNAQSNHRRTGILLAGDRDTVWCYPVRWNPKWWWDGDCYEPDVTRFGPRCLTFDWLAHQGKHFHNPSNWFTHTQEIYWQSEKAFQ